MNKVMKYSKFCLFISIFIMFFSGILEHIGLKVNYVDDLMLLCIVLIYLYKLKNEITKEDITILILSIIFLLIGITGNIVFQDQKNIIAILGDILSWQKFVLNYFMTYKIFKNTNIKSNLNIILKICKAFIITGYIIYILSLLNIFKIGIDYRYGICVLNLGVHAQYACAIYSIITAILFINKEKNMKWIILSLVLVGLTLRSKGFGYIALVILMVIYKKKISIKQIIITLLVLLLVGSSSISYYYLNPKSVRAIAINTSFKIANDNFPIGSGFGTYGTVTSTNPSMYSKTYEKYGLDQIYGFSKDYGAYAGDGGVATIIGQFGFIGTMIFIIMLILILKKLMIFKCLNERNDYIILLISYIIISATNETCFNSNLALIYSTILSYMTIYKEKKEQNMSEKKIGHTNNRTENKENILFSIIVPIYNVEKYLENCIESILKQNYKNIEIILVDDGSPDECPKICDSYAKKDKRIKVVHKTNAGLGMARNSGLEISKGEYLFFLDSDDFLSENMFSTLNDILSKEKYDYVYFGYNRVDDNAKFISEHKPDIEKDVYKNDEILNEFLPNLISGVPYKKNLNLNLSSWTSVISKKVIEKSKWKFVSEREYISEDVYSYLKLFKDIKSVKIIDECFYNYRCNNASLSRRFREDRFSKIKKLHKEILKQSYNDKITEHFEYLILSYFIYCIKSISMSKLKYKEKINLIKEITSDELTKELCEKFVSKESLSRKVIEKLILNNNNNIIYLITYLKSAIKGE